MIPVPERHREPATGEEDLLGTILSLPIVYRHVGSPKAVRQRKNDLMAAMAQTSMRIVPAYLCQTYSEGSPMEKENQTSSYMSPRAKKRSK